MNINEKTVVVNVKKHTVAVTDELVVHIHHHRGCAKPCVRVDEILQYLEDELFVVDGYSVSGEI
jgi:hypothetical protein